MKTFSFWQKWLFTASMIIILFGILMALFSGTSLFNLLNQQINPVFWGTDSVPQNVKDYQQFVYGVLGATMAGWGVFLAYISFYPFKKKEKWSRNCIIVGMLVWFITDTSISVYYKVYINAVSNVGFLILTMLPVIFTRKYF